MPPLHTTPRCHHFVHQNGAGVGRSSGSRARGDCGQSPLLLPSLPSSSHCQCFDDGVVLEHRCGAALGSHQVPSWRENTIESATNAP